MNSNERSALIESRKDSANRTVRLWCKDEWKDTAVFRVPVEALLLNVDNRRFAAERTLMEDKLGHSLDPENSPTDELSVISILLDTSLEVDGDRVVGKPSKDYEALRTDWLNRKQETPFWVRPDGKVRNGNRRLAMLKRLREEEGIEGHEFADAVILDHVEINEHDLFEMEQREQLTENLKVRYTDINLLLALREAAIMRGVDWADAESIDRVAGEIRHLTEGDKAYAAIQLRAIRYMDAYLQDSNASGQYQKLIRQVERFRDVGKVMTKIEEDYPDDAPDMLRLAFAAISAGNPHGDIRAIRRMFIEERERYKTLLAQVEKVEDDSSASQQSQLAAPSVVTKEQEDEGDEEGDVPGPVVENYPSEQVRTAIKNAIDGLNASALNVSSTLEQASNRLETLTRDRMLAACTGEDEAKIRSYVERIIAWADDAKSFTTRK
jgi:hypothetical protein